jgi:hypothetical protein
MDTEKIRLDKSEFVGFLQFATNRRSLTFSTNSQGRIWPTAAHTGRTTDDERVYVEGQSDLLDRVAGLYTGSVRNQGGKFRIDIHGAFCFGTNCYFIEWTKSQDLIEFENSIPGGFLPPKSFEWYAQLAKNRLN